MKAKKFPEANTGIGFGQDEYQGIPAFKETHPEFAGMDVFTMCFELSEEELKQVQETGYIWIKRLQPKGADFHPIGPDFLQPEGFKPIVPEEPEIEFNAETFNILEVDFNQVNYFFKKQAAIHLKLEFEGKSEEAHTKALMVAQIVAKDNKA